jgi:flavin-dependent dehydrogenase
LKKISIVGAGISGLSAAIKLAEADFDVTVYEKQELNSAPTHTSVIRNYAIPSIDALEEIRNFGIVICPNHSISKVIKVSPNFYATVKGEKTYYSFQRGNHPNSLEKQLFDIATKKGVTFEYGNSNVKNYDIVAKGHKQIANIIGYGKEYRDVTIEKDTVYLFYDNEISPQGYLCVIPSKDLITTVLSVSFGSKINFNDLKTKFDNAVQNNKILKDLLKDASQKIEPIYGYSFYKHNPILTCNKNGVKYIGDAGGFQDASRGFGIRYAILTGIFAAQSIITGIDYNILLKQYFGDEFLQNHIRRKIFNTYTNNDYDIMIQRMGKTLSIQQYVSMTRKSI